MCFRSMTQASVVTGYGAWARSGGTVRGDSWEGSVCRCEGFLGHREALAFTREHRGQYLHCRQLRVKVMWGPVLGDSRQTRSQTVAPDSALYTTRAASPSAGLRGPHLTRNAQRHLETGVIISVLPTRTLRLRDTK